MALVTSYHAGDSIVHCKGTCMECTKTFNFDIPMEGYRAWQLGTHIQHALPELDIQLRELMISGICGWCFDQIFADSGRKEE